MVANPSTQPQFRDFWSDMLVLVTITNLSTQIALNDVVVAGLPDGFTIDRVVAMLKIRSVEDSSGVLNRLTTVGGETPAVQVQRAAYIDGINLQDDQWEVAASSRDSGDVQVGDIDVQAQVDQNATINFRLDDVRADGNNLLLHDVQTGLRVYYTA